MDAQREALERTIAAGANVLTDRHAALLALCRELAAQMDGDTPDSGPSTRLVAAYLSALKDLGRALNGKEEVRTSGKLAELRGIRGAASGRRSNSGRGGSRTGA